MCVCVVVVVGVVVVGGGGGWGWSGGGGSSVQVERRLEDAVVLKQQFLQQIFPGSVPYCCNQTKKS